MSHDNCDFHGNLKKKKNSFCLIKRGLYRYIHSHIISIIIPRKGSLSGNLFTALNIFHYLPENKLKCSRWEYSEGQLDYSSVSLHLATQTPDTRQQKVLFTREYNEKFSPLTSYSSFLSSTLNHSLTLTHPITSYSHS